MSSINAHMNMNDFRCRRLLLASLALSCIVLPFQLAQSFMLPPPITITTLPAPLAHPSFPLRSSSAAADIQTPPPNNNNVNINNYEPSEDAIIKIKPKAMLRLMELKQKRDDASSPLVLRMGVRNGGCSGLSYVMDFSTSDDIQAEDEVDVYENEGIQCVVDAKSLLYLYGLELDYSEDLIGGGFKFFNPNAEESCGCGSSFGV